MGVKKLTFADITRAEQLLEGLCEKILLQNGWERRGDNPGSIWTWSKTINTVPYRCDRSTALLIEEDIQDTETNYETV